MTEPEDDPLLQRVVSTLRQPVEFRLEARRQLLDALAATPSPRRCGWLILSPLVAGALAAGLIAIGALGGVWIDHSRSAEPRNDTSLVAGRVARMVQFVLVAPNATRVSLVGDFNGWDAAATAMHVGPARGVWSVAVPLTAGRHLYAFVVDERDWRPDPDAPLAADDGFGMPNSVILVDGPS